MSGAMMMKSPLRISRMIVLALPCRSIELPPKRLRHFTIRLLKKGLFILWKNPEVRGQCFSLESALKIMLPSIPVKCIFTKIRGFLLERSTADFTSIMLLSCFALPHQIILFSTRLRPSNRQCSLARLSISAELKFGKHKCRFVLTTRFLSLGMRAAI